MRKEPEIVHILREEERLRNSQMNSSNIGLIPSSNMQMILSIYWTIIIDILW